MMLSSWTQLITHGHKLLHITLIEFQMISEHQVFQKLYTELNKSILLFLRLPFFITMVDSSFSAASLSGVLAQKYLFQQLVDSMRLTRLGHTLEI